MKLKFRVWEGEKYLSLSKALKEGLVGVQYDRGDSFELESYYKHVTIEMFTGLTDENSVEIFEGDIFRDLNRNDYTVRFEDGAFRIYDGTEFAFTQNDANYGFIVGNIREVYK